MDATHTCLINNVAFFFKGYTDKLYVYVKYTSLTEF